GGGKKTDYQQPPVVIFKRGGCGVDYHKKRHKITLKKKKRQPQTPAQKNCKIFIPANMQEKKSYQK
ncbi:hypothetical protein ACQWHW_24885, partial [Salmonella enterica subsp. enterica serovar Infantis]